ncbi:hypothetical protein CEXT_330841 [Caerostris extrusa]|uniref:Uncharacterized protein n=1 Tax=Caerostris extrusa TaxID=172846 RepID=A0AAV4WSA8_CAEEX|nr:hypothetical protein CEXT_330841 [Caerostris extrusa]
MAFLLSQDMECRWHLEINLRREIVSVEGLFQRFSALKNEALLCKHLRSQAWKGKKNGSLALEDSVVSGMGSRKFFGRASPSRFSAGWGGGAGLALKGLWG